MKTKAENEFDYVMILVEFNDPLGWCEYNGRMYINTFNMIDMELESFLNA